MVPPHLNSGTFKLILDRYIPLRLSNEKVFLFICAVVAFLLRFFLIPQEAMLHIDSAHYLTLGGKIANGDWLAGIHAYWPPMYPFLIAVASIFTGDLEFAGRLVSIAAGTLLVIPVYFLIRDLQGRVPAYYGTVLAVVHPFLVVSSGWVLTESFYTLIFTLVVFTGWKALRGCDNRLFFVTGVLLGIAYLTKPEAIGFLALFVVLVPAAKFFCRKFALRSLAVGYLLLFVGFAMFCLPYVAINHQKTGHWIFSQKLVGNISFVEYEGSNLELTNDGKTTRKDQVVGTYETETIQSENSISTIPGAFKEAKFDYATFLRLAPSNLKKEVREHIPTILSYPLILLVVVGIFYRPWSIFRTAKEFYLLSFFIATLIGYAVSVVELRYLFPIIPILLCWASNGIVAFSGWVSITLSNLFRRKRIITSVLIQLGILIVTTGYWFAFSISTQNEPRQLAPWSEKQIGLWIKNNKTSPSLVIASSPLIAFHAEAKHIYLPNEELSTVLAYARLKNVNYVVLSTSNLKKTPKILVPEEQYLPVGLKLVYKYGQVPDYEMSVYELLY